ncbi:partial diamine N-acetyltransferase, partial [Anaerolineae bacterium]
MVAQTINSAIPRGARPLDPVRDIYPIARLLEEAFRADRTFPLAGSPLLRELGIFLWALNYMPAFPPTMTGFVWIEDGRVVGNVTLTQEEGHSDRFMISNVAVKTEYRRQGIARALMVIVLDYLRERGIKTAILNVRPNNPGAIKLYTSLGFHSIEMRG